MTGRAAMYVAMEYRLEEVLDKRHESYFHGRHNSGYFDRIWSVHPMADRVGNEKGLVQIFNFTPKHTVIEGVAELLRLPKFLLPINVLVSQSYLLRLLARTIRENDISVIVVTDPFYAGLVGLALKRMTGRPLVVRVGGNYEEMYRATRTLAMPRLIPSYRLQTLIGRFVLRRADLVSGNNQNNLSWGIANGARRHTAILPISGLIHKIHLAAPEEREGGEELFKRLGLPWRVPTLLFLARLVWEKHPEDALRAMAYVMARHANVMGVFAGAGPMLADLQAMAASLGISERVRFLGQTTQEDLLQLVPHCITLSPWGGLALIEAALGGSPVVGYNRDWQEEFIEDGVSGFIVPDRDFEAMAQRALQIIRDPQLARNFSKKIRERALRQMDPGEVARLEKEAFDKVLAE